MSPTASRTSGASAASSTDKLHEVEKQLDEVKEREALLASTLVSAERAAVEAKEAARREAELIVAEAHGEARSVTRAAQARARAALRRGAAGRDAAARGARDGRGVAGARQEDAEPGAPSEYWPRREDTREFHPVAVEAEPEPSSAEPAQLPPVAADRRGGRVPARARLRLGVI